MPRPRRSQCHNPCRSPSRPSAVVVSVPVAVDAGMIVRIARAGSGTRGTRVIQALVVVVGIARAGGSARSARVIQGLVVAVGIARAGGGTRSPGMIQALVVVVGITRTAPAAAPG